MKRRRPEDEGHVRVPDVRPDNGDTAHAHRSSIDRREAAGRVINNYARTAIVLGVGIWASPAESCRREGGDECLLSGASSSSEKRGIRGGKHGIRGRIREKGADKGVSLAARE